MISRFFKKSTLAVFMATMLAGILAGGLSARASTDTRTLSLYFQNTGESLTVTYKKNGRYVSSAMQKLNRFLWDWRGKKVTRMDPVTIDLLWELYQDLGSKVPVRVVSGYRSPSTNAMLRRLGRKVARRSQHMVGKAIDVYFPDVPLSRLRGSALARRVGGVGYYPRNGFVHLDSGTVRNWPRISPLRLASIIRQNRSTIGARFARRSAPTVRVASATTGPVNIIPQSFRKQSFRKNPARRLAKVPVPRPRPLEVAMAAAAAETFIVPASAPAGKQNFGQRPSLISDAIGTLLAATNLENNATIVVQRTNKAAKSSFAGMLRAGTAKNVPLLKPMLNSRQTAYAANEFWWSGDMNKLIRRDGAPRPFSLGDEPELAESTLTGADKSALATMIAALTGKPQPASISGVARSGKTDSLIVNRAAKSDMFSTRPTHRKWRRSARPSDKLAGSFEAILKSADQPIGFSR